MKKIFKSTLAAVVIVAVSMGSVRTYLSYSDSNQTGVEDVLLAENVLSYAEGNLSQWCGIIDGVYKCISALGDIDKLLFSHYTYSHADCILRRDCYGNPIPGSRQVCIKQDGSGDNQCTPGYVGPCL